MIHGETYLLCNMGLCACAYPLGGRLAGLPLPRPSRWMLAAALGGAGAICALFLPSPLWLVLLPAGVVLCFGHFGWQACLRCLVTTLCAALLCGGTLSVLLPVGPVRSGVGGYGGALPAIVLAGGAVALVHDGGAAGGADRGRA